MTTTFTEGDKPTIDKDPNAVLDYVFNWSLWLSSMGDTIASSEVIINDGVSDTLILDSIDDTATTVTAWLSGGTVGTKVKVTCRITTANTPPRIEDRSVYIKVKER